MPSTVEQHIAVLNKDYAGMDALGGPKLDIMYHHGWAYAGAAPFQGTKLVAAHLGGTRTPLVISWPKKIKHDGKIRTQFHHVNDIAATVYEILAQEHPGQLTCLAFSTGTPRRRCGNCTT